jgi:class 3 adenylate cyclase
VAKANVNRQALVEAIAALESQREPGDRALERAVATALAALRDKLAELQSTPGDHQQRQLAVLVADLSGFTALSERMDAEKVREALNAMWRVLDAVVLAHGGQIDQHAGDSLLALFGLPQPRTGDAARALRTALTLQLELTLFNERVRQAAGAGQGAVWAGDWPGPAMRVGVHSGPVYFARAAGSARLTAVGETIAVARRLEHAAPAGRVLTSAAVLRQAGAQLQFEAAPDDLAVAAGRPPGETVFLATGERPDQLTFAPALVAGQMTRLIGRDDALDQLENALQAAVDSGAPQIVTLQGAPGAGKSRLVHEFEARARLLTGVSDVLRADGRLFEAEAPYALVRDLLLRRFGIRPQHSHFIIEDRLRRVLDVLDRPERGRRLSTTGRLDSTLELLKQLLDARVAARLPLDDVQQLVERLLGAITAAGPAILILEDVHRADRQSLALVERLARAGGPLPVLVLAVAADGDEALPWLGQEDDPFSPVSRLEVGPLSPVESRLMVTDILSQLTPPPMRLLDLIVAESGGNPLYIEAFTRLLMERGVIALGERRGVDMAQAERTRLPAGLARLIETRQLALADEAQRVLQAAAVVGSLFWDVALLETRPPLLDDLTEPEIEAALLELEHRRFILRDPTYSFRATQAYRFRREVGHQVAYESLPPAARRTEHRRVAQWLIAQQSDDRFRAWFPAEGLIARHFAAAEEPAQAAVWQRRAGQLLAAAGA